MAVLDRPIVGWSCGTPSPYVEDKCWSFIPRSRPLRSTEKNKIPFSTCLGTPQPPLGIPSMIASGLAAHPGHVYVHRHHHVRAPADRPRRSRLHPRTWLLPPASFVAPPGSCRILPFFQQQSACLSSPIFAFSRQAPLSLGQTSATWSPLYSFTASFCLLPQERTRLFQRKTANNV